MSAVVLPDMDAVAEEAARRFEAAAKDAIAARGLFCVALTGGSAATQTYPALRSVDVDWTKVHVFWGDERAVPPDSDESNHKLAQDALLSHVAIPAQNVHRMRGEAQDLGGEAVRYEAELNAACGGVLDVVHLGMGPDGHVCSLFPHHRLLQEDQRLVWYVDDSPKPPPSRLTLTLPALAAARAVWFLVGGRAKERAVSDALTDPHSALPAAMAHRGAKQSLWLLDADAARIAKQS